ncbi:MAG: amidophosphoribosyltransferase [Flavobacteriaceae bacterium]|nr:amidophosphoribosyltransferase [Flavobacteriaceae bacterium]
MLNVLFPKVCGGCSNKLLKGENTLCASCIHSLPLLAHHKTASTGMTAVFYGRVPLEQATALLRFTKKGITQELLHNLKYRGNENIGVFFGKWLGAELAQIQSYTTIDCIIPVPIHKLKKRKRGYNQVTGFGLEISKALQKPMFEDVLLKKYETASQVFKQRFTRFNNEEVFTVKNEEKITGKHILIVDDIITTGATLENCANKLLTAGASKISLATIAMA